MSSTLAPDKPPSSGPPAVKPGLGTSSRSLGLPTATAMVVGSVVGSGIFGLPSAMAAFGPMSLVAFLVVTLGALALAWTLSLLSRRHPESGGAYVFARESLGDFAAFLMTWSYWIAGWCASAAVVTALVGYVEVFINTDHDPTGSIMIALVALWLPALINITGIRNMGNAQVLFTALKFIPLLLLAVVGIFFIDLDNFGEFNPTDGSVMSGVLAASAVCLYSYLGIESAAVTAGRVKDPLRNVPRATMIGTVLTAALYFLCLVAIMGTVPREQLAESSAPFTDSANAIFGGQWAGYAIAIVAVLSCFGLLIGWTLVTAEAPAVAAIDHQFPKIFAKTTKKNVPVTSILISTALASLLVVFGYTQFESVFETMLLLSVVTNVIPYLFSAAAQLYWMLRHKESGKATGPAYTRNLVITLLAMAFIFWTLTGSGQEAVFYGVLTFFFAIPVYAFVNRRETLPDEKVPEFAAGAHEFTDGRDHTDARTGQAATPAG